MSHKLKFAKGNAKLENDTAILSLPAGHTCPFAKECFSKSDRVTGKITDGMQSKYRCYAASAENLFETTRISRWRNYETLKNCKTIPKMVGMIYGSLPRKGIKLVRVHASGDFFSQTYFDAWLKIASAKPNLIFYAYTKALPYWIARKNRIPANFKLVASRGGKFDNMIKTYKLRNVRVVFSEAQASKFWKLKLDHDDKLAWQGDENFALLLHGTQPAGTKAAKALYKLRKLGQGGYKGNYFEGYKKKGE